MSVKPRQAHLVRVDADDHRHEGSSGLDGERTRQRPRDATNKPSRPLAVSSRHLGDGRARCPIPSAGADGVRETKGVADPGCCLHNESVPNILVRDLPDDVHRVLQDRAEHRGQSLQQYLSSELTRLAARPTVDELFERVSKRRGGKVGLAQAVADLEAERSAS
jgi:antitoxin FitA